MHVRAGLIFSEDVGLVHQSKGVLDLPHGEQLGVVDDHIDNIDCVFEVLLLAEALGLQDLSLDVLERLSPFPLDRLVILAFQQFCLVESVDRVVVVALGHERLGQRDIHADLQYSGLGQLFRQLLIFMESNGDVLYGLFAALVGEVGLAQVVVRDDQPEIRLAVVEHQQLVESQLLDFDVDQLLATLAGGCRTQIIQFLYDFSSDLA